jgi:hypothetical protein
MPGRFNFASMFTQALQNQEKMAFAKDEADSAHVMEQQKLDLQAKSVDQAHSDQMAHLELQKQQEAVRQIDAQRMLSAQNEQNQRLQKSIDLQIAEADRKNMPIDIAAIPKGILQDAKPYIRNGVLTADNYKTAVDDYNKRMANERENAALQRYNKGIADQENLKLQTGIMGELQRKLGLSMPTLGELQDRSPVTPLPKETYRSQFGPMGNIPATAAEQKAIDAAKADKTPLRIRNLAWQVDNENKLAPLLKTGGPLDNIKRMGDYARANGTLDDNANATINSGIDFIRTMREQSRGKVRDPFISLLDEYENQLSQITSAQDYQDSKKLNYLMQSTGIKTQADIERDKARAALKK